MATQNQPIFPIRVRKQVERLTPLGNPRIESSYHKSLEQGRMMETSIGDATYMVKEAKKYLDEQINSYLCLNLLATDGQLPDKPRAIKYVIDAIKFMKQVKEYQQETMAIVKTITGLIGQIQSIEQSYVGMIQVNSNALATLMNEICNWNLPTLPGIPNFFSDFGFDGFSFPWKSFNFHLKFDKDFAFGACKRRIPVGSGSPYDMFRNFPRDMQVAGVPVVTPMTNPPLGGYYVDPVRLLDPQYPHDLASITAPPVFTLDYVSAIDLVGNLPDPKKIVSNYHMDRETYYENISTIVDIPPSLQLCYETQFEPNHVASWILWLHSCREARKGDWLSSLQKLYDQFIASSYNDLSSIPWNNLLNGPGLKQGPDKLYVADLLRGMGEDPQGQILWMLSHVESSLLGVTRNHHWDAFSREMGTDYDPLVREMLSDQMFSELDYHRSDWSTISQRPSKDIILNLGGVVESVISVPDTLLAMVESSITTAENYINQTPTYLSPHPQNRAFYDLFSGATLIDGRSQFWKDFVFNWNSLMKLDPYLVGYVIHYQETLDQYLNPLSPSTLLLSTMKSDILTRDRNWLPGSPVLPTPTPLVTSPYSPVDHDIPVWDNDGNYSEYAYLMRPDISVLTPNQKMKMSKIQKSYETLMKVQDAMVSESQAQVAALQSVLSDMCTARAELSSDVVMTPSNNTVLVWDHIDTDTASMVHSDTIVIPEDGAYVVTVSIAWSSSLDSATRTVALVKNGSTIVDSVSSPVTPDTSTISKMFYTPQTGEVVDPLVTVKKGDILSVQVSHNVSRAQKIDHTNSYIMITKVKSPK